MPTDAENVATTRTNLLQAMADASARLVELNAMPIGVRVYFTYTEGDQTYNWGELRRDLREQIKEIKDELLALSAAAGPYTVIGDAGL